MAIDFETANVFPGSVCAVGLVRVADRRIIDEWFSLIRPPKGYDYFDPWHVNLHGITAADVAGAGLGADVETDHGVAAGDPLCRALRTG